MATRLPGPDPAFLAEEWGFETGIAIQRDLSKAVSKVIATGAKDHYITELKGLFDRKRYASQRARAHGQVAATVAQAVQGAVAGIESPQKYPPRRSRMSGGLDRAVKDPNFTKGDQFGIQLFDRDTLNREARHWQRINFGTGELQDAAYVAKPRLGGRQLMDVTVKPIAFGGGSTLANPMVPSGFFMEGGGLSPRLKEFRGQSTGNPFLAQGKHDFRQGSAIRPQPFLDAGLRAFEKALPSAYMLLVDQYGRGKGTSKHTVPVKA